MTQADVILKGAGFYRAAKRAVDAPDARLILKRCAKLILATDHDEKTKDQLFGYCARKAEYEYPGTLTSLLEVK